MKRIKLIAFFFAIAALLGFLLIKPQTVLANSVCTDEPPGCVMQWISYTEDVPCLCEFVNYIQVCQTCQVTNIVERCTIPQSGGGLCQCCFNDGCYLNCPLAPTPTPGGLPPTRALGVAEVPGQRAAGIQICLIPRPACPRCIAGPAGKFEDIVGRRGVILSIRRIGRNYLLIGPHGVRSVGGRGAAGTGGIQGEPHGDIAGAARYLRTGGRTRWHGHGPRLHGAGHRGRSGGRDRCWAAATAPISASIPASSAARGWCWGKRAIQIAPIVKTTLA